MKLRGLARVKAVIKLVGPTPINKVLTFFSTSRKIAQPNISGSKIGFWVVIRCMIRKIVVPPVRRRAREYNSKSNLRVLPLLKSTSIFAKR